MSDSASTDTAHHLPRVVVLSRDLFFGMRIRNALKQMEFQTDLRKTETELVDALSSGSPALILIDFNAPVDWEVVSGALATVSDVSTVAFGSHTDTDGFRKARESGVSRVISNGAFTQQLPDLVEKYSRRT